METKGKTFKIIKILPCKISEHKDSKVQINNKKDKHCTNSWMVSKIQLRIQ